LKKSSTSWWLWGFSSAMRAADLLKPAEPEQQPRPYPDWLLVASRSGELELRPGEDAGPQGSPGAPSPPELARQASCSALFDGILYNRAEIERRLRVSVSTDAELVAEAYLRWGESALCELKGTFALVIGDRKDERVICARDRLGLYPLFYADAGDEVLLSTSIEVMLRDPRVSHEVNRAALADHLAQRWPDPGETYYSGIRRVPSGHALIATRASTRNYRYWSPVPDDGRIDWLKEDELGEFEVLLQSAVARFLLQGPAGIYLSGGLDSVSVAAMAASVSRGNGLPAPWALSLGFSHPEANEQAIQRQVAADLDLPQLLVPLEDAAGPQGLVAASLELNGRSTAPMVNMWLPAYNHLAAEGRKRGIGVILTGHGGDEWLSVTPYYAADLIFSHDLMGFFKLWNNHRRSYPLPTHEILWGLIWRFGTRPLLSYAANRIAPGIMGERRRRRAMANVPAWVAPDPQLRAEIAARAQAITPEHAEPGRIYQAEMNLPLDHPLVAMELEEAFENGRKLGVRFGFPFWDADLLTFLYRTPPELLNRGGRSKGLVREMLSRRFPEVGFERHRKVAGTPVVRTIILEEGGSAWRKMGGVKALDELGIVDGKTVRTVVSNLLNENRPLEKRSHLWRVWDILALEAWSRAHS
jgi:asparagine synthase (glutamine-hydrolysing)